MITLDILRRIIQEVNAARDLEQALQIIVRRVKQAMEVDVCSVYRADRDGHEHVLMATDGLDPSAVGAARLSVGAGIIGLVAKRAEPVNIENAPAHPSYVFLPETGEQAFHAFLGVPIIQHRRVLGVLLVQKREPFRFDENTVSALATLAAQLAGAITHAEISGDLYSRRGDTIPAHRTQVFISYSHKDTKWLERLQVHLKPLVREAGIVVWDDTHIQPGENWRAEIELALASAAVVVLLVSPDFLASEFIAETELPPLLEAAERGGSRILPVILSHSRFSKTRLGRFQAVNDPDRPLTGMAPVRRDKILVEVGDAIESALAGPKRNHTPLQTDRTPDPSTIAPMIEDQRQRELSQLLEGAYKEKKERLSKGEDTTAVQARILQIRREIRAGGYLQEGDFLSDGRFKLLEHLGAGGFATIWKALDDPNCRLVAIKVLHGQYAFDRSRRERFFRGAHRMAALHHQGIVRVLNEKMEDEGYQFFVMEYLEGGDLHHGILDNRIPVAERLRIVIAVGDALEFAHEQGVIHRDIKPANIVLDKKGRPKLTDFDLVRAVDTTGGTRTGPMGTFVYSAPEVMSRPQDAKEPADVYGLGMTAIFSLWGKTLPMDVMRDAAGFVERLNTSPAIKDVLN